MPTQRDAAAYKRQYRDSLRVGRKHPAKAVMGVLAGVMSDTIPVYPERAAANIDAYTDILMERGLCSSVLNWHTRPARADDLEW